MTKSQPNSFLSWPKERVLVTGGAGFLGSHVVKRLRAAGCLSITIPRSRDYDLRKSASIERLFSDSKPTLIINLAANCGVIGKNMTGPAELFFGNAALGIP